MSPENLLILVWGPSTDTRVWGGCRHGIFTKSPQTGFFSESYSGGKAAEFMTATGFDAVVIHGAAHEPVWLEVCEEAVYFHPAGDLWGLDTYAPKMRSKPGSRITVPRPAMRRDGDRPGRGEAGRLCRGGKRLLAQRRPDRDRGRDGIEKHQGHRLLGPPQKTFAARQVLKNFARSLAATGKDDAGVQAYKSKGTPMLVDIMNNAGGFPTRYWQKGKFEGATKTASTPAPSMSAAMSRPMPA
jgi:aldehyde:ferredoxin oxidoreductase